MSIDNLTTEIIKSYSEIIKQQQAEIERLTCSQTTQYCEQCKDYADEIERLKAQQQWIPCSERLPDTEEDNENYVLVCMEDDFIATTTYIKNEGFELWADSGEVIAWKPLPKPYESEVSNNE